MRSLKPRHDPPQPVRPHKHRPRKVPQTRTAPPPSRRPPSADPESVMDPTQRTPAGDQYSLGCTLYYCLTGRVPFPEGSAVEKMMAHQTKTPLAITELASDVPAGLVAVVTRLMAKTPEGRFSGSDEVVEAIVPFLGNLQLI